MDIEIYDEVVRMGRIGDLEGVKECVNNNPLIVELFDFVFNACCPWGQLEVLKWLLSMKPDINISLQNESPFRFACTNGHLEVAKWLLQIKPNINISENREYAFVWSTANNHLEVAKWLLQISKERGQPINISANDDCAFRYACIDGHLEAAQWLYNLNPNINIFAQEHHAFTPLDI